MFHATLLPAPADEVAGLRLNVTCVDAAVDGGPQAASAPTATCALGVEEETLVSVAAPQFVARGSRVRLRAVVLTPSRS